MDFSAFSTVESHILTDVLMLFKNGIGPGSGVSELVWAKMKYFAGSLFALEVCFFGFRSALSGENFAKDGIMLVLKTGFLLYMVQNWDYLTTLLLDGCLWLADAVTLNKLNLAEVASNPSAVVAQGLDLAWELTKKYVFSISVFLDGGATMALLAVIVIIIAFLTVGLKILFLTISYYVLCFLALFLFAFNFFEKTKALAGSTYIALLRVCCKITLLALVSAVLYNGMNDYIKIDAAPNASDVQRIAIIAVVYCFLCIKIPDYVVNQLLSGPAGQDPAAFLSRIQTAAATTASYTLQSLNKLRQSGQSGALGGVEGLIKGQAEALGKNGQGAATGQSVPPAAAPQIKPKK